MPDTKISAMTPAASVMNADLLPIVQALANLRATKQQLLEGGAGENITLKASTLSRAAIENFSGQLFIWLNDNNNLMVQTPAEIQLAAGTGVSTLRIFASGNIDLVGTTGTPNIRIGNGLGFNTLTLNGATGAWFFPYAAAVPGNWALPVPTDVWTAIERLLAAVFAGAPGGPV